MAEPPKRDIRDPAIRWTNVRPIPRDDGRAITRCMIMHFQCEPQEIVLDKRPFEPKD